MLNYRLSLFVVMGWLLIFWCVVTVSQGLMESDIWTILGFIVMVCLFGVLTLLFGLVLAMNLVMCLQYRDYRRDFSNISTQYSDAYLYGWKIGRPHVTHDGRLHFLGDVCRIYSPPQSKAICTNLPHKAVKGWCDCGFWAYNNYRDALKRLSSRPGDRVIMRVALHGEVLPYTKGWRATNQTVTDIAFGCSCHHCKRPEVSHIIAAKPSTYPGDYYPLHSVCAECIQQGRLNMIRRPLTIEQFVSKYGIGVYLMAGDTLHLPEPYIPDFVEDIQWS